MIFSITSESHHHLHNQFYIFCTPLELHSRWQLLSISPTSSPGKPCIYVFSYTFAYKWNHTICGPFHLAWSQGSCISDTSLLGTAKHYSMCRYTTTFSSSRHHLADVWAVSNLIKIFLHISAYSAITMRVRYLVCCRYGRCTGNTWDVF